MRYRKCLWLLATLIFTGGLFAEESAKVEQPDANAIINRVAANWRRDIDAERDYTYQARSVTKSLNKKGEVTNTRIKTYEVLILFGKHYRKLIELNDKPLSAKEQKNEEEKLNKFFDKRQNMSEKDRAKEMKKEEENAQKFKRELADELPKALKWEIIGDEILDGQPVWAIVATPNMEYKPKSDRAKTLSKMSGKFWVSKADYKWMKVETDLVEDFKVGWFLVKIDKGTHIELEQTRINDEVWLPKRVFADGSGRVLFILGRVCFEITYSQYQKFTTDVKIKYH